MRVAAIGDVHCRVDTPHLVDDLVGEIKQVLDVLVLAGDLTDIGLPDEMDCLLSQLAPLRLPIVAVLGNHDHENGSPDVLRKMLVEAGVHLIEGDTFVFGDVGFAGAKGYCGGFNFCLVEPFGEADLKAFIHASIAEAAKIENALSSLDTPKKVAVIHYSPVEETLVGEPSQIYPFLGTSRLADAVDRAGADVIVHGHSHGGSPEGKTKKGIPVYNVCRFVQMRYFNRPYYVFDI